MTNPPHRIMSVEEYLELDRNDPEGKYEYVDGYVYNLHDPQALAGRSKAHSLQKAERESSAF